MWIDDWVCGVECELMEVKVVIVWFEGLFLCLMIVC